MELHFKKDKYSKVRGGYSRRLKVYCRKCNNYILSYQKDGPGNLRRMYFDRIFDLKPKKQLVCNKCKELLGIRYVYPKENRKSFRLFQDAVIKKVAKLN